MITMWFEGESRQESSGVDGLLQEDRRSAEAPSGPTEWVSPLVLAPKPDGDSRISDDMRRANEIIERDPFPTIEEVLHDVNGSTVLGKLISPIMSYYSLYYTPRFLPVQEINVRNYLRS